MLAGRRLTLRVCGHDADSP